MVKMRYVFMGSVCIHGLLALSVGQYISSPQQKAHHSFSVVLLNSPKNTKETIRVTSQKNSTGKLKKQNVSNAEKPTTRNTNFESSVIYNPSPTYPVNAKANGQEGVFSIKLLVNQSGNVEHIEVTTIKGNKTLFEEELCTVIKTWKFSPCSKEMSYEIPISFLLDQ